MAAARVAGRCPCNTVGVAGLRISRDEGALHRGRRARCDQFLHSSELHSFAYSAGFVGTGRNDRASWIDVGSLLAHSELDPHLTAPRVAPSDRATSTVLLVPIDADRPRAGTRAD